MFVYRRVGYIGVSKNTLRFGGDSTPLAHHLTFGTLNAWGFVYIYMCVWVFPKNSGTPKWMVKIMENPMNKWMIRGENPLFSENPLESLQSSGHL